jgi:hypothetical protein
MVRLNLKDEYFDTVPPELGKVGAPPIARGEGKTRRGLDLRGDIIQQMSILRLLEGSDCD